MKSIYPIIQLSFIILKAFRVVDWDLWFVFSPTLIIIAVFTPIFLAQLIAKKK